MPPPFAERDASDALSTMPNDSGPQWQQDRSNLQYGWIIGLTCAALGVLCAFSFYLIRRRRRRLQRRVVNFSESLEARISRPPVDLAPLLDIQSTHSKWGSEHTISENSRSFGSPTTIAGGSLYSPVQQFPSIQSIAGLPTSAPVYAPVRPRETYTIHEAPHLESVLASPTSSDGSDMEKSPMPHSLPTSSTEYETRFDITDRWDGYAEKEDIPSRQMSLTSSTDSDSMAVQVPWQKYRSRYRVNTKDSTTEYTVSPSDEYSSSSGTPGPSALYLRALEDERLSSLSHWTDSPIDHESVHSSDQPHSASGSGTPVTPSTASSRWKLRLNGSLPYLPLIEESSPWDADRIFSRFRAGASSRASTSSSAKSKKSTGHSTHSGSLLSRTLLKTFPRPPTFDITTYNAKDLPPVPSSTSHSTHQDSVSLTKSPQDPVTSVQEPPQLPLSPPPSPPIASAGSHPAILVPGRIPPTTVSASSDQPLPASPQSPQRSSSECLVGHVDEPSYSSALSSDALTPKPTQSEFAAIRRLPSRPLPNTPSHSPHPSQTDFDVSRTSLKLIIPTEAGRQKLAPQEHPSAMSSATLNTGLAVTQGPDAWHDSSPLPSSVHCYPSDGLP